MADRMDEVSRISMQEALPSSNAHGVSGMRSSWAALATKRFVGRVGETPQLVAGLDTQSRHPKINNTSIARLLNEQG